MTHFALAVIHAAAAARRRRRWPRARFRRGDGCGSCGGFPPHGRGGEIPPEHPRVVAPRRRRLHGTVFVPSPAASSPRVGRLAACLIEPPSDAMWPVVPTSVRLPEKQRHYGDAALGSCFGALVRSVLPTTGCVSQQGTARTLAPLHESRTTKILSAFLAAIGLDAASALCHYPLARRSFETEPHARNVLRRQPPVVTEGRPVPDPAQPPPGSAAALRRQLENATCPHDLHRIPAPSRAHSPLVCENAARTSNQATVASVANAASPRSRARAAKSPR